MSDLVVRLVAGDGTAVEVDLLDDVGPVNTWKSRVSGAWGNDSAAFTNQAGVVHAKGCGVVDCWTLYGLDIDKVHPGMRGKGVSNDPNGSFPTGDLQWTVV